MAEAALDKPTAGQQLKYFCHECSDSVEINTSSTDATSLTCPKCDSYFIEELTQELENDHLQTENTYSRDPLSFLDRSNPSRFLSSMLLSLGSMNPDEDDEIDSDDDDVGIHPFLGMQSSFSLSQGGSSASTAARDRNGQQSPFHRSSSSSSSSAFSSHIRFLEQLLGNLRAGRNLDSSNQSGEFPNGFPQLFQGFHGDPRDYAWGADGIDNIITELLNQSEGTGPPPATKEDIDILPSVTITQDYIDHATQCSVCLENFALDETVKCLPCEHIFHSDCVVPWLELHRTCPICRKPVGGENCAENLASGPSINRGKDGPLPGTVLSVASSSSSIFQDAVEESDQQPAKENDMDVEAYEDVGSSVDMEN